MPITLSLITNLFFFGFTLWLGGYLVARNSFLSSRLGFSHRMPAMLGMFQMIFAIGQMQWMSLMGHIIYTTITAWVFKALIYRGA